MVRDGQNVGQLIQTLVSCGGPIDRQIAGDLWLRWSSESSIRGTATRNGRQVASLRWEVGPTVLAGARLAAALTEDRQRP